jgi:hydrogenase expression/formation protein HypE
METLSLGKLPPDLLEKILLKIPILDEKVIIGPETGMDCSVIDIGDEYLVLKTDPISLTAENIGWYAVEINVNDIVTTGASPKWMLTTLLLPEHNTTSEKVEKITNQLILETNKYGITIIGGHTEITHGIDRPILSATMIGTVQKDKLISPKGIKPGDIIFLTKEIAIETISILANDFSERTSTFLTKDELIIAQSYLHSPGISVFPEARILREGFGVTGMHDPTEGGFASAIWEMSIASNKKMDINLRKIPVSDLTLKICSHYSIDPLKSMSSGALLFTASPDFREKIISVLSNNFINVSEIGTVSSEGIGINMIDENSSFLLDRPERDDITKIF